MFHLLLGIALVANSPQNYVSTSSNGTLSIAQLQATLKLTDKAGVIPVPTSSVKLTKVIYQSTDFYGKPTKLSGLIALPTKGAPRGIVVFYHGTTSDDNYVPSRYTGGKQPAETALAVGLFASGGYAVALPDYLGLGDNPGVHPYPLGSINAKSGIDMINPLRLIAQQSKIAVGNSLFISGYSEGGAVALWAAKQLQDRGHPNYVLTATAGLSGPYDMSGVMAQSLISNQSNPLWLLARMYLAAYCGYSMSTYYPDVKLSELFVPSFASYIPYVFKQGLPDKKLTEMIAKKGVQLGAIGSIRKLLQPAAVTAMREIDLSNPFMRVMESQNIYDWKPESPLFMVCLKQDYLVSADNTRIALKTMIGNGVANVGAHAIDDAKLNHVTAAVPAVILARQFFDGGLDVVPTSLGKSR